MALIVEDGTIVANANSYASETTIREYAAARGVTLPVDDADLDPIAIQAMDYIESFRGDYSGSEVEPGSQPLSFPRKDLYIYGTLFASDKIPQQLISAECQLCIDIHNGIVPMPSSASGGQFLTRQKLGPIEREFSEAVYLRYGSSPQLPAVRALLKPLLRNGGSSMNIPVLRV